MTLPLTSTDERRKAGVTLAAMLAELTRYSQSGGHPAIEKLVINVYGDSVLIEALDAPWGAQCREFADALTLDDAFIALSHKLAGAEEAPF